MPTPPAVSFTDLEDANVHIVVGTMVNAAGLTLAKTVPVNRASAFIYPGLGASPLWHTFAIDQVGVVTTPDLTAVGDQRLRLDRAGLHLLGDGMAWAPLQVFDQDGNIDLACSRSALARIETRLSEGDLDGFSRSRTGVLPRRRGR